MRWLKLQRQAEKIMAEFFATHNYFFKKKGRAKKHLLASTPCFINCRSNLVKVLTILR
jgi:hypothetical protein